jgi:hypothetical protein
MMRYVNSKPWLITETSFQSANAEWEASLSWRPCGENKSDYKPETDFGHHCNTAHQLAAKAIAAREGVLGAENLDTLTSVSTLAQVLQYQGKYEEAETLNRQALEGRKRELGERHPDTLTSVSNLAGVLHN